MGYSYDKEFNPGDQYIGIDNGCGNRYEPDWAVPPADGFRHIQAWILSIYRTPPTMRFMERDGSSTPFDQETVDEVLMANVLSDPLTAPLILREVAIATQATVIKSRFKGEPYTIESENRVHYLEDQLGVGRERLLLEAARIVKVGGRIVVNSYLTPNIVNHEQLAEWFQRRGFATELLTPSDAARDEKTAGYLNTAEPGGGHRFFVATKLESAAA